MSSIARVLSTVLAGGAMIVAGTTAATAGTCKGHPHTASGSAGSFSI